MRVWALVPRRRGSDGFGPPIDRRSRRCARSRSARDRFGRTPRARRASATPSHHLLCGEVLAIVLAACAADPPSKEQLGKQLFTDPGLSYPTGQACADCHAPQTAFRDPESDHTTSMGAVQGRFGARNTPTAMYAAAVPPLHYDGRWVGGLFWDGRADSLEQQAGGPLMNPLEMNNRDRASVVNYVRTRPYANAVRELYGGGALDTVDGGFTAISDALAAYERSPALSPFSSRYDHYVAGTGALTTQELHGMNVFTAHCASCHPPPLFTDFGYANLGIPHYGNSAYDAQHPGFVDHGLMTTLGDPATDGMFRTPTLRNIARTAPYGHNGYFENLPYLLDFLNTRDVGSRDVPTCSRAAGTNASCAWPAPEVPATVDHRVGNLGLSHDDLDALAAFLDALTDE
jgi:cytochrome c peroxidase